MRPMSLTSDPQTTGAPSARRRSRTGRVVRVAARRVLPPFVGIVVLLGAAYVYFGPGISGLPHAPVTARPTVLLLVSGGQEPQAEPTAAAPSDATDASQSGAPADAQPTPQ